jgi:hypothetical protein
MSDSVAGAVRDTLEGADGPVTVSELVEAAGCQPATMRDILHTLRGFGVVAKAGENRYALAYSTAVDGDALDTDEVEDLLEYASEHHSEEVSERLEALVQSGLRANEINNSGTMRNNDPPERLPNPGIAELTIDGRLIYRLEHRDRDLSELEAAAMVTSLRDLASEVEETVLDRPAEEIVKESDYELRQHDLDSQVTDDE